MYESVYELISLLCVHDKPVKVYVHTYIQYVDMGFPLLPREPSLDLVLLLPGVSWGLAWWRDTENAGPFALCWPCPLAGGCKRLLQLNLVTFLV